MRLLTIATILATIPTVAAAQMRHDASRINGKPACQNDSAKSVNDQAKRAGGIHKLGEMPPAKQYLAVLNKVDGCSKPIVLRRGISEKQR